MENAFTYLKLADNDGDSVRTELPSAGSEVEEAMGEYFESLNEVATLLHDVPLKLVCVAHVWNADACRENPRTRRNNQVEFKNCV